MILIKRRVRNLLKIQTNIQYLLLFSSYGPLKFALCCQGICSVSHREGKMAVIYACIYSSFSFLAPYAFKNTLSRNEIPAAYNRTFQGLRYISPEKRYIPNSTNRNDPPSHTKDLAKSLRNCIRLGFGFPNIERNIDVFKS